MAQYEAEVESAKNGLSSAQLKVVELKNSIQSAEAELEEHSEEAVQAHIEEAARIWEHRSRSPHNASIVEDAIYHASSSEVVVRILNARLVQLRDSLAKHEQAIIGFQKELKDLEKR
ncbi:MAG: hypothetical protein C5B58_01500 [Acidobacteria bacterium]|nr:MAG: hypothetical protein C5B58_01500 [Acidobacteriota bacterium]